MIEQSTITPSTNVEFSMYGLWPMSSLRIYWLRKITIIIIIFKQPCRPHVRRYFTVQIMSSKWVFILFKGKGSCCLHGKHLFPFFLSF